MKRQLHVEPAENTAITDRIIALWAFSECGLGGLMHAFQFPFSGIVVGGLSVLFITLISLYTTNPGTVLPRALTIVLLVKFSVSPHSPVPAYFAVTFQAFAGLVIYRFFKVSSFSILLLTCLTFLVSALQKLLILTFFYGNSFWDAINTYIKWIDGKLSLQLFEFVNSQSLVIFYLLIYLISGVLFSVIIRDVIRGIEKVEIEEIKELNESNSPFNHRKRKSSRIIIPIIVVFILILFSFVLANNQDTALVKGIYLLTRSLLVLIVWIFILAPLLKTLFRKYFIGTKSEKYKTEVENIIKTIPHFVSIANFRWHRSKEHKGVKRLTSFLTTSIAYSLKYNFRT